MKSQLALTMGYREQAIRCCALCRFATYGKTGCTKAHMLDAGQDKETEDAQWEP